MKNNILKSVLAMGTVFVMTGCGGGSTSPVDDVAVSAEETVVSDVPTAVTLGTETISPEIQEIIDGPVSKISQELINTLAYMGNEERLAYDVYNALYKIYNKQTFTNPNK